MNNLHGFAGSFTIRDILETENTAKKVTTQESEGPLWLTRQQLSGITVLEYLSTAALEYLSIATGANQRIVVLHYWNIRVSQYQSMSIRVLQYQCCEVKWQIAHWEKRLSVPSHQSLKIFFQKLHGQSLKGLLWLPRAGLKLFKTGLKVVSSQSQSGFKLV